MPRVHEGALDAAGKKIAVVAGRFNEFVTSRLVSSAVDCLVRHGAEPEAIDVYWVPGAFEIPQMASRIGRSGGVNGIVCVGTIIRGETNHFDNLCACVIQGIADVGARCDIPVAYGVVTADSLEQAMNRAGGKSGNKGWDSALALVEMMSSWKL